LGTGVGGWRGICTDSHGLSSWGWIVFDDNFGGAIGFDRPHARGGTFLYGCPERRWQ
jgi:hypothetical protein